MCCSFGGHFAVSAGGGRMARICVGFACLVLLCVVGIEGQSGGERPQLTNNRVVPLSATVANEYYEYLLTTLEFDQDIYVNDAFLCAGQELDCTPTECVPCDWSIEEPTGCDNPNCCGPAQWPQFPASNHVNDWCNTSLHPYTKLEYNEPSEVFSLSQGEYKYFRFFVGEEEYCRSIHVEVTTRLGDMSLSISKFVAYPDQENLKTIENGQLFEASSMQRLNKGGQFGQSVMTICPNVNPAYERGTFSIAVSGFHEYNEATVTVYLAEDRHPIQPPEDRIRCDDIVPDDVFREPPFIEPGSVWAGNACLEEGVTSDFFITPRQWYDVVLPIQPGCHEVSLTYNGFTNTQTRPGPGDGRIFIHCGSSGDFTEILNDSASLINRYREWATFYLSACFEEVTYLHCSVVNRIFAPGTVKFHWTSKSKPIRHKISEASPAMLTTYYGRNQVGGLARELNYQGYEDWGIFGWSWLTQPTTDPLVFYPPDRGTSLNYTENPLETYLGAGFVETKSNLLNFIDLTTKEDVELRSRDILLESGFIYLMGITGANGMPVELCSDDALESGECQRGGPLEDELSWTDFLTTRTYSTLNIVPDVECDGKNYKLQNELVQRQVENGLESFDVNFLRQKEFIVDLYNAGLARTSCVMTMEMALATRRDNVTRVQDGQCLYEIGTTEYLFDPCCSPRSENAYCCESTTVFIEEDLYTDASDTSELSCRNSDCDQSFFADIATSLNAIGNPLTGCASGIENSEYELRVLIESQISEFIRPCLVSSGYGDTFSGVECRKQEDCEFLDTTCDLMKGMCRAKPTSEIRDIYFECFFENMPPLVEDYIRTKVLSPTDADLPKDSKYFKYAVRTAASQFDCVGRNPYDLEYGERWAADAALYCKGQGAGIIDLAQIEAQEDLINEICPEFLCLGQKSCRWEDAKKCKTPTDRIGCLDNTYHRLVAPSESSCPIDETICSIAPTMSSPSCEGDEYQCVVCLSEWDSCETVAGVDTEEECERLVACEMPGGGMRYDLTEEECLNFGECTSLCDGQSCRSVDGKKGACVVLGATNCEDLGGVEVDGECILEGVKTTYECDMVSTAISLTTEWYMCETMDVAECGEYTNFTAPYQYLRCFVDIFQDCTNEDECLATGTCSDVDVAKNIIPDPTTGWFSVSYGTCLSSGAAGSNDVEEPDCLASLGEFQYTYGCYFKEVSSFYCDFLGSPQSFLAPYFTSWIEPARTEETCRQEVFGRYGCALPKDYEKTFWFWGKEDCECKQGTSDFFFSWTPGSWERGTPHPLTWTQKEVLPKYSWEETLSLVEMESWVQEAVEDFFVYRLKSQLVCEGNYVSSSLGTLVCDCVEEDDSCFNSEIETEVGISGACANKSSVLKGPPSFTTFDETSINELCTEVSLYLIQRSWFLFPRSAASVSFQFEEKREKGVVLNGNGAEVGAVIGDGSNLVFKKPERVDHFLSCLLISEEVLNDNYEDYSRRDFGIPVDDFTSIKPLGLKNIEQRQEDLFVYWCANLTSKDWSGDGVTLFPIVTLEDYEDEEYEPISHRTESLVYTLAACYIFDLIIVSIYVGVMIKSNTLKGNNVPMITYLGVILGIVCVIRIVFCFIYVDDGFTALSEYLIFEIPTFLLFTGVILVIVLFMQLSKKNTFDFRKQDKGIWAIGFLAFVICWALLIIVAIVYSEVILEEDDESVCPGRVQPSNDDVEDDTRTLSIVYQTIVIFLTLLFALVFLKLSINLFRMTKHAGRKSKKFIFRLGAITVISFLLRSILFLVLLASDITSDIYLFITLFLTEVVMILLIALELNKGFYLSIAGAVTGTITSTSSVSRSVLGSQQGVSQTASYQHDN